MIQFIITIQLPIFIPVFLKEPERIVISKVFKLSSYKVITHQNQSMQTNHFILITNYLNQRVLPIASYNCLHKLLKEIIICLPLNTFMSQTNVERVV